MDDIKSARSLMELATIYLSKYMQIRNMGNQHSIQTVYNNGIHS